MNPDQFLDWLRFAIRNVGPGYYGLSERVYCYELYHFLRVAMSRDNIEEEYPNLFLHSEIVKVVLNDEQARDIGVIPLARERHPDFILHEPFSVTEQVAVLEVKVTPNINYEPFIKDIEKLSELRANYHFELGSFHCINSNMERLRAHLLRASREERRIDPSIVLLAVPHYNAEVEECSIEQLV